MTWKGFEFRGFVLGLVPKRTFSPCTGLRLASIITIFLFITVLNCPKPYLAFFWLDLRALTF